MYWIFVESEKADYGYRTFFAQHWELGPWKQMLNFKATEAIGVITVGQSYCPLEGAFVDDEYVERQGRQRFPTAWLECIAWTSGCRRGLMGPMRG